MSVTEKQDSEVPDVGLEQPGRGTGRRVRWLAIGTALAVVAVAAGLVVAAQDDSPQEVATRGAASSDTTDTTVEATTTTTAALAPQQQASPAPPAPPSGSCVMSRPEGAFLDGRFGSALIATPNAVVIHGGRGSDFKDRTDTWTGGCSAWQKRQPTTVPPGFEPGDGAGVFDAARGQSVLLANGETWVWTGSDWSTKATGPRLGGLRMSFDVARQRVFAFGLGSAGGETWAWDGTAWSKVATGITPETREGASLVYDSVRQRTYLFGGGHDGGREGFSDTWAFDGSNWTKLDLSMSYPAGPMLGVFDAKRGVTIALAFNGANHRAETWTFDGSTWRQVSTSNTPTRRNYGAMAYVPAVERVVMFGGKTSVYSESNGLPATDEEIVNDLWIWDGSDWRRLY